MDLNVASKATRTITAKSSTNILKASTKRNAPQAALTTSRPELLVEGSDQQFRRLVHDLFAFQSRHQTLRDGHAAVIGLPGIEYTTLIAIRHLAALGDVHVKTVAKHLHLSGAFVTTVTNKLEIKGLIEKAAHSVDRRRLSLTVTARGAALLERLAPIQMQVNDVEFDCLNTKEFQQLIDMLHRLVDSSDRAIALQRYLAQTNVNPILLTALSLAPSEKRKSRKK
jgi:DNA-binding MarR family transcriptional regulator